eukprot:scaffold17535_cov103-Isochrysis_galbana.AAC.2
MSASPEGLEGGGVVDERLERVVCRVGRGLGRVAERERHDDRPRLDADAGARGGRNAIVPNQRLADAADQLRRVVGHVTRRAEGQQHAVRGRRRERRR